MIEGFFQEIYQSITVVVWIYWTNKQKKPIYAYYYQFERYLYETNITQIRKKRMKWKYHAVNIPFFCINRRKKKQNIISSSSNLYIKKKIWINREKKWIRSKKKKMNPKCRMFFLFFFFFENKLNVDLFCLFWFFQSLYRWIAQFVSIGSSGNKLVVVLFHYNNNLNIQT